MRSDGNSTTPRSLRELWCEVVFNRALAGPYRHLSVAAPHRRWRRCRVSSSSCCARVRARQPCAAPADERYRIDRQHGRVEFLYKVVGSGTRGMNDPGLAGVMRPRTFRPIGARLLVGAGLATCRLAGPRRWPWQHSGAAGRDRDRQRYGGDRRAVGGAPRTGGVGRPFTSCRRRGDRGQRRRRQRSPGTGRVVAARASGRSGARTSIATCGSSRLLRLVQRLGRELGIAGQVALEQPMACGIGMCFCWACCLSRGRADGIRRFATRDQFSTSRKCSRDRTGRRQNDHRQLGPPTAAALNLPSFST